MTERQVLLLAVGVWCGALVPLSLGTDAAISRFLLVGCAVVGFVAWRREMAWTFLVVAMVGASLAAAVAWAGIEPAVTGRYLGEARLAGDPQPVTGGVRVTAEIEGRLYDLRAWGSPAGWLRPRLMGETVHIDARLRPLGDAPEWLRAKGLSGRGSISQVSGFDVGSPHTRIANSVRRTIETGAASMTRDDRALFAGLVYGDDRAQSPLTADNFKAAGLTHLLAVSGQNVAFVLAIAGPLLRRLGHRGRFGAVVAVLVLFATVTRFEASVVRASTMAAVAAFGALLGSETSSRRVLWLAIAGLILVDPLIVHSVAFQLSVAASAGILLWSGRVARALPGPRVLAESLAVTASAQIAVAPLLLWKFDGLPVASLPANLLAGPAAGPVMMWGLTGGLVAGLVPAGVAEVMHLPTRLAVWWIDSVAALAVRLPLGELGAPHVALLYAVGAVGMRARGRVSRVMAITAIAAVLAQPAIVLATSVPVTTAIDGESIIWRDRTTTIVELDAGSRAEDVLAALRRTAVGDIDALVVHQSTYANATLIDWIKSRHRVDAVLAPLATMGVGEVAPGAPIAFELDGFDVTVVTDDAVAAKDTRLRVEARAIGSG